MSGHVNRGMPRSTSHSGITLPKVLEREFDGMRAILGTPCERDSPRRGKPRPVSMPALGHDAESLMHELIKHDAASPDGGIEVEIISRKERYRPTTTPPHFKLPQKLKKKEKPKNVNARGRAHRRNKGGAGLVGGLPQLGGGRQPTYEKRSMRPGANQGRQGAPKSGSRGTSTAGSKVSKVRKSNFYADAALHMRNFKQLVKKTATEELVDGGGGGGGGEYGTFYSDRLLCPDSDDFFSNRFRTPGFFGEDLDFASIRHTPLAAATVPEPEPEPPTHPSMAPRDTVPCPAPPPAVVEAEPKPASVELPPLAPPGAPPPGFAGVGSRSKSAADEQAQRQAEQAAAKQQRKEAARMQRLRVRQEEQARAAEHVALLGLRELEQDEISARARAEKLASKAAREEAGADARADRQRAERRLLDAQQQQADEEQAGLLRRRAQADEDALRAALLRAQAEQRERELDLKADADADAARAQAPEPTEIGIETVAKANLPGDKGDKGKGKGKGAVVRRAGFSDIELQLVLRNKKLMAAVANDVIDEVVEEWIRDSEQAAGMAKTESQRNWWASRISVRSKEGEAFTNVATAAMKQHQQKKQAFLRLLGFTSGMDIDRWMSGNARLLDQVVQDIIHEVIREHIGAASSTAKKSKRAMNNWKKAKIRCHIADRWLNAFGANAYRLSRRESTVYIKDALDKDGGRFGDNLIQAFDVYWKIMSEGGEADIPAEAQAMFYVYAMLLNEVVDECVERTIVEVCEEDTNLVPLLSNARRFFSFAPFSREILQDIVYEVVDEEVAGLWDFFSMVVRVLASCKNRGHRRGSSIHMLHALDFDHETEELSVLLDRLTVKKALVHFNAMSDEEAAPHVLIFMQHAEFHKHVNETQAVLLIDSLRNALQQVVGANSEALNPTELHYVLELMSMNTEGAALAIEEFLVASVLASSVLAFRKFNHKSGHTGGAAAAAAPCPYQRYRQYGDKEFREHKKKTKALWIMNEPNSFGQISLANLEISLYAAQLDASSIQRIVNHFERSGCDSLGFHEFVLYMPFFEEMHTAMCSDGLAEDAAASSRRSMANFSREGAVQKVGSKHRWRALRGATKMSAAMSLGMAARRALKAKRAQASSRGAGARSNTMSKAQRASMSAAMHGFASKK